MDPIEDLLDRHALVRKVNFALLGVTGTAVGSFGIVANLTAMLVLIRRSRIRFNTKLYLCSISMADSLVLLFSMATFVKDTSTEFRVPEFTIWANWPSLPEIYIRCHALSLVCQVASNWLTVALAIDRYVMICHRFLGDRSCSRRNAICILAFILCCSFAISLPRFFEFTLLSTQPIVFEFNASAPVNWDQLDDLLPSDEKPIHWYQLSSLGSSVGFRVAYHSIIWLVLVVLSPLICIGAANAFLVREMRQAAALGGVSDSAGRRDTNRMLVAVIVFFLFCQTPAAVHHIVWTVLQPVERPADHWFVVFGDAASLLIIVNSASNILLYYSFSRQFRTGFCRLCCPKFLRKLMESRRRRRQRLRQLQAAQWLRARPFSPQWREHMQPIMLREFKDRN